MTGCAKGFNAAALEDEMAEAIESKDFESVLDLAARGADLETTDGDGNAALIIATIARKHDVMKELLNLGAEPNHANYAGFNALRRAIENTDKAAVELLLGKGATITPKDYKQRVMGAFRTRIELIPSFVEAGAADIDATDFAGQTGLMLAAQTGNIELATALLEMNPDLEVRNNKGETALGLATAAGLTDMVRFLIEKGADIDTINNAGKSLAEVAEGNEDFALADMILNIQDDRRRQQEEKAAAEEAACRAAVVAKMSALKRIAPRVVLRRSL